MFGNTKSSLFRTSPLSLHVMAPKFAGKGNRAFVAYGKATGEGKEKGVSANQGMVKLHAVQPGFAHAKFSLRPGLDRYGGPFYGERTPAEFLSTKNLVNEVISPGSCEWANRLGFAMSLGGCTIHHGAGFVKEYVDPHAGEDAGTSASRVLASFGLRDLASMLKSTDGAAYVDAMKFLNESNAADRDEAGVRTHMRRALRFPTMDGMEKHATLRRLATSSSKLYLLSMEMLAQVSLVNDPGSWQDKLRRTKKRAARGR